MAQLLIYPRTPGTFVPRQATLRWGSPLLLGLAVVLLIVGCLPVTPPANPPSAPPADSPRLSLTTARRQSQWLTLADLHLPGGPTHVEIGTPTGPGPWPTAQWNLWVLRRNPVTLRTPAAEQFLGTPMASADGGSVLLPMVSSGGHSYDVPDASTLVLQCTAPPTLAPGIYHVPLRLTPLGAAPGAAATVQTAILEVTVSDLTLPAEPATLALASTSAEELAAIYPQTFGKLQATYLDRADPAHKAAIEQLDALTGAAQRHGIALFMEDLSPVLQIDEVGHVALDWDAYDRTMFPYMDGSAFPDRVPLPVWLAPLPPRRIRDTPPQLRQYWTLCLEHFRQKGWSAVPVLLHPALMDSQAPADFRQRVMTVLAGDIDKAVAVVATPDYAGPHPALWATDDADRRLAPVGPLATPQSVSTWPWMCLARQLRGMLWRHAVGGAAGSTASDSLPLFTTDGTELRPTLRLAWLTAGLNDAAHYDLLAKRGDPAVAREVLAAVVGRTGLATPSASPLQPWPGPPLGYLYAGWPRDPKIWQYLPAMVDRLTVAAAPGQNAVAPPTDPLFLSTRMWLAQAHRPVARVSGYRFGLAPGRDGSMLEANVDLSVENPVGVETGITVQWNNLPGDLTLQQNSPAPLARILPPYGLSVQPLPLTGHLDALTEPLPGRLAPLRLTERVGGAMLELPVMLPFYRMKPVPLSIPAVPRIDGRGDDWPLDARATAWAPMPIALRYASRPALLAGQVPLEPAPEVATARWTYDAEWIYGLIHCPQRTVADDRTSEWPVASRRWWGTDGLQIQIAGGARLEPGTRIVQIGLKPSGTVLTRSATIQKDQPLAWADGPTGLRYGIRAEESKEGGKEGGYTVEVAIPRAWFAREHDKDPDTPLWRLNVLRHRAADLQSAAWSGPLLDDTDIGMMGLLVGGGR